MAHINRDETNLQRVQRLTDTSIGRWVVIFAGSCAGLLLFLYLALWAFNGFHGVGLDWAGTIALTLGTILAAGLGVGLMGLIFYSDRSERDREVGDSRRD